ncbi:MAG: carboxylating nicotinate-nucleotide diphosphorylase [Flavobacteriales bacterium]|nr:carboxylating nicotinate-nucleotide diphosphorylase [Flavobacteriales bacterium]
MPFSLDRFVKEALEEDIQNGDHTTLACISVDEIGSAELIVKEEGMLAGVQIAERIFHQFDPTLEIEHLISDGTHVTTGQRAFKVHGKVRSMLTTERLVLNLMQRMSGIATTTATYVKRIEHTKAKVLDTRKTTPGLRWFEKEGVKIGGGVNHRFGLYDMILIKDNHVDGAGSITGALNRVHDYLTYKNLDLRIELEVRNFEEISEALNHGGLDRIMLDNFSVEDTRTAIEQIQGKFEIESSGGITLDTIHGYAETGVDFISVGALTHSVKSLDLSLKIIT